MGLVFMKQHKLDLENSVNKISRDKINTKMLGKTTRKSHRGKTVSGRLQTQLKMTETEAPCREVVLKSKVRKQKILDTLYHRDIDLVPCKKGRLNQFD